MRGVNVALIQPGGMRPERELELVKSALLFADQVEVSSASLWLSRLMVDRGRNVINGLDKRRSRQSGKGGKRFKVTFDAEVEIDLASAGWSKHCSLEQLVEGLDELRAGRMRFRVDEEEYPFDDQSLRLSLAEMQRAEQAGLLIPQWDMVSVRAALGAGTVMPFWDEAAASEIGFPDPGRNRGALEGHLARELLAEVPVFPSASMDVLLDVRERLANARARFCIALARAADELRAVPDVDLPGAIEALRRTVVEESLIEIDETLEELRAKPTLIRMASDRMTLTTATATIAITASGFLGPISLPALANTVAIPAITATVEEWSERRRLSQEAARQPYWLLSEARRSR